MHLLLNLNAWNSLLKFWRQNKYLSSRQTTNSCSWALSNTGTQDGLTGEPTRRQGNRQGGPTRTGEAWQRGTLVAKVKGLQLSGPKAWKSACDVINCRGILMIRLTDKMGIFSGVNIINKQTNRNSPVSSRKYSCPLLQPVYELSSCFWKHTSTMRKKV